MSEIEPTTIEYLVQHPFFRMLIEDVLPPHIEVGTEEATLKIRQLLKHEGDFPELKALDKIAKEFSFEKGDILAHQGEYADQLYVLREGRLETQKEYDVPTLDGLGKMRGFVRDTIHLQGACFDDTWIFQGRVYPYYIKALRDGRVVLLARDKFLAYLKKYPKALRRIFPNLSPEAQKLVRQSRFQEYLNDQTWWGRLKNWFGIGRTSTADSQARAKFDKRLAQLHTKFQLRTEESIHFQSRRSQWVLMPRLIVPIVLLIALPLLSYWIISLMGLVAGGAFWLVFGVSMVLLGITAVLIYFDWSQDWFLVTDQQIIHYEYDLFRLRSHFQKVPIDKVQSIEVETPNLFAKIFKLGTARITTAAQSDVVYFDFISTPKDVQNTINTIREQSKNLSKAKILREMRTSAEGYHGVTSNLSKLDTSLPKEPPSWFSIQWKTICEYFRGYSHRFEKDGVITYHKHRITLLGAVLPPILIGIGILFLWYALSFIFQVPWSQPIELAVMGLLSLANLAYLVWQFEDWRNDSYQISERYVIDIDRLPFGLRESRKQAELNRIENIRAEKVGLIPSLFNYGQVYIDTAGAASSLVFEKVYDPDTVQNDLFKKRDKLAKKLEETANAQRRREYAIFVDQFNKTATLRRTSDHRPLLEEHEDGLRPT